MTKHNNIFIYLFLILIILSFSFYNSQVNQPVENFIPSIRKMYRPHFRKIRMYQEDMFNNINKKSDIFFRRMGLY